LLNTETRVLCWVSNLCSSPRLSGFIVLNIILMSEIPLIEISEAPK
jgi:hypothetical protein